MKKNKHILSESYIERVLKQCGAKQVTKRGKEKFVKLLEEKASEVISTANKIAVANKRVVVQGKDISLALEE